MSTGGALHYQPSVRQPARVFCFNRRAGRLPFSCCRLDAWGACARSVCEILSAGCAATACAESTAMPEGNTIHRLAREHASDLGGRIVRVSSPQGRFAAEARRLDGRRFRTADAYGKHLFHFWEGAVVHVHLGMAGEFYRFEGDAPSPRPTVRMRLTSRLVTIDLIGPPTCELISPSKRARLFARLGPDPLRDDARPERAWERIHESRRPIGDLLLDQSVVAGAGNIYRNEALFLAGIHPLRAGRTLTPDEWTDLWTIVRELLRRGVAEGRARTVRRGETPNPLARRAPRDPFYVYKREVCRRCGTGIREFPLSGRRMFACPVCQASRRVKSRGGRTRVSRRGVTSGS